MNILITTCSQALIYSILSLGLFIAFRVLNFADMTAEGSLTLGGSVCALLITKGLNPILSLIISGLIGSLAGLITGFLHTKLKIQAILSGILTMTALYSINIKILGKANLSLLGQGTIFKFFGDTQISNFLVIFLICAILLVILILFFKTRLGLAIRATGDNEQMMRSQGINTDFKKILALMLSNAICAVAGALIAQSNGYADVTMGMNTIVIALASIVIGEVIIKKESFMFKLTNVILGSVCYRFIILFILKLGMNPSDLKLFTAIIVAVLLALPSIKKIIKRSIKNVKNCKFMQNFSQKST
ncbi:MAG: ABC transporter permease [Oscillospiraceae bacterium]|jgi:putative ABC transport system permease protein|nr:ABC transporter permease [Oscillospiraceae bacterium]